MTSIDELTAEALAQESWDMRLERDAARIERDAAQAEAAKLRGELDRQALDLEFAKANVEEEHEISRAVAGSHATWVGRAGRWKHIARRFARRARNHKFNYGEAVKEIQRLTAELAASRTRDAQQIRQGVAADGAATREDVPTGDGSEGCERSAPEPASKTRPVLESIGVSTSAAPLGESPHARIARSVLDQPMPWAMWPKLAAVFAERPRINVYWQQLADFVAWTAIQAIQADPDIIATEGSRTRDAAMPGFDARKLADELFDDVLLVAVDEIGRCDAAAAIQRAFDAGCDLMLAAPGEGQ